MEERKHLSKSPGKGVGRTVSSVQVLGEQQIVVRPGEVAHQLLERVELHLTKAAIKRGRRLLVGRASPG